MTKADYKRSLVEKFIKEILNEYTTSIKPSLEYEVSVIQYIYSGHTLQQAKKLAKEDLSNFSL